MIKDKIYFDKDASLEHLKGLTVGIIGYGIQGRAQALNLRDNKINILVANRSDHYVDRILADDINPVSFDELAKKSDILMMLIPDQAHQEVVEKYLQKHFRAGQMLVVAHGYSLTFEKFKIPKDIDVTLLAPRMPGQQIRREFLKGHGVPAFVDVVQDASGHALDKVLALGCAIGFTKAGLLQVNYKDETELDLFCEQYLVTNIVKTIKESFEELVTKYNYPPVATLMELYASAELGEVLTEAARVGIGEVFQNNASPTCQFGIAEFYERAMTQSVSNSIGEVIKGLKSGQFDDELEIEGKHDYEKVNALWKKVNSPGLIEAQKWIETNFKIGKKND